MKQVILPDDGAKSVLRCLAQANEYFQLEQENPQFIFRLEKGKFAKFV
jgi:hypothetical protein